MTRLTIADIAQRAGVSKATVSRVLNRRPEGVGRETRERIQAILDETGFQPSAMARSLATGESRSVGLIIPDISNPFYPLLVLGAEAALNAAGYGLFLCNTGRDMEKEAACIRMLIDKGVDGVLLDSAGSDCDCHLSQLDAARIPVVLLDRVIGTRSARCGVFVDNQQGARDAARHLFATPHRRLVFLNGPAALSQSIERRAGVEAALRDAGVPPGSLQVLEGDFSLESGYRLIAERIAAEGGRPGFNAVFAANDVMALGALRALRQAGIAVPGEVEVIGFDDIDLASFISPALTTMAVDKPGMGRLAVSLLSHQIEVEKRCVTATLVRPELIERETVRTIDPPARPIRTAAAAGRGDR